MLNSKQVNDVGRSQDFVETVGHGHAELLELAWDQRARADERDARTEFGERKNIRACDAAKKDIADNHDVKSRDRAFSGSDRVEIEQRLRRMFVRPVARVNDAGLESLGEELRGARRTVAQHDEIGMVSLEDFRGGLERCAFAEAS